MKRKVFITIVMNRVGTGLLFDDSKQALPVPPDVNLFSSEEQAKSDYLKVIREKFVLIPKIV